MTPQEFVDWGRRIADGYADAATRRPFMQRAHEFDADSQAAYEFLGTSNGVARALTVPGGQEKLAQVPGLRASQPTDEAIFNEVYQSLRPMLNEILEGMWLGEWVFNDSGLIGMLKIDRQPAPETFRAVYIDSQGITHETVVTRDDEEFGTSYESLHIGIKDSYPEWKIHAYIFRWNRLKMGGIVDHGETEGRHSFYAVKREIAAKIPIP